MALAEPSHTDPRRQTEPDNQQPATDLVQAQVRELLAGDDGGIDQQQQINQGVQVTKRGEQLPRNPQERQPKNEVRRQIGGVASETVLLNSAERREARGQWASGGPTREDMQGTGCSCGVYSGTKQRDPSSIRPARHEPEWTRTGSWG